jgi:hypothetical protein
LHVLSEREKSHVGRGFYRHGADELSGGEEKGESGDFLEGKGGKGEGNLGAGRRTFTGDGFLDVRERADVDIRGVVLEHSLGEPAKEVLGRNFGFVVEAQLPSHRLTDTGADGSRGESGRFEDVSFRVGTEGCDDDRFVFPPRF